MPRADWTVELIKVYRKHGRMDPELLVSVAKDPDEPLHHHPFWTWKRDDAAEWAWREQARRILNHAKIKYTGTDGSTQRIRSFHAVPVSDDPGKYAWQPTDEVVRDETTHKLVLREMNRKINELRVQYGHLEEYREALLQEVEDLAA